MIVILVIGKNGQLAFSFNKYLKDRATYWGRTELGTIEEQRFFDKLDYLNPSLIVNTAAYTAVDKAESETQEAFKLNVELPQYLVCFAKMRNVPLVHFSTDYVYSGTGQEPWDEEDFVEPINVYGETKLKGEQAIWASNANAFIFRTSWVYNYHGANFVKTILRLASEREQLRIVSDQIGSPTYSDDLARILCQNLDHMISKAPELKGVYNIAGKGFTSWYEFSKAIVEEARALGWNLKVKEILPISTEEYPTPARRPKNSRMSQEKIKDKLKIEMPEWRSSLRICLRNLKEIA